MNVISGPTTPRKMRIGSRPMIAFQSGMTNSAIVSRIVFQSWLRASTIVTSACYPTSGRPRRGLPFFVVAPRPGFQRGPAGPRRRHWRSRPCPGRRGTAAPRRAPVPDRRRRQLRPLQPAEQPRGPGRPRALRPERGPQRVVVADDEQGRRSPPPRRPRASRPRATAARRRPCAGRRGGRSARTRSARRACPSPARRRTRARSRSTPGTIARSRPIRAACGAAPGLRDRAWSRFVPSMSSRSVPVSGSRGRVDTAQSYARIGRRLRSAA